MQLAQIVTAAGGKADQGEFEAAAGLLTMTWDDLVDEMTRINWANPDQSALETLVAAICLRNFIDRTQDRPVHRFAAAMYAKIKACLGERLGEGSWANPLHCIIDANLAENHRQAMQYDAANHLFGMAQLVAPSPTFSVGATTALMQGILAMQRGWLPHEHFRAARQILTRPTGFAPFVQTAGATIMLCAYGDEETMREAIGLPAEWSLPRTHDWILLSFGFSPVDLWEQLHIPLYRPI